MLRLFCWIFSLAGRASALTFGKANRKNRMNPPCPPAIPEIYYPTPNAEVGRFVDVIAQVPEIPSDGSAWVLVYAPGAKKWYPTRTMPQGPIIRQRVIVGSDSCDGARFEIILFITNKEGGAFLAANNDGTESLPYGTATEVTVKRRIENTIYMNDQRKITITGSTNTVIGNANSLVITQNIEALLRVIDDSKGSSREKDEAKSLLKKFLAHPLITAIAGGAAGAL